MFLFSFTQQEAQGTSLAALIPPIGIFAAMVYYRNGDVKIPVAAAVAGVLSRTLAAKPVSQSFNPATGKLKLVFKRPNQDFPALELTDTIEVAGLV